MNNEGELITTEQSTVLSVAPKSADALAVRVAKEVEGAMIVAKRFPRDENVAIERIRRSFQRTRLAEAAEYEYSRGGTKIVGPTVDALRAVKMAWGNIQSGWMEVERKPGISTVVCYAMDLETNARAEVTFQVRHMRDRSERKGGSVMLTDERDIYELVANMAARRERKCLEDVIPADIVDEAIDQARKTLKGGSGEPLADRIRKMSAAFSDNYQITVAMLEKRLNHKLDACSENELAGLRRVYKSLYDGVGKREDFFEVTEPKPAATTAKEQAKKLASSSAATEPHPGDADEADAAKHLADQTLPPTLRPSADDGFDPVADMRAAIAALTDAAAAVALAEECENLGMTAELDAKCRAMQAQSKAGAKSKQRSLPGE